MRPKGHRRRLRLTCLCSLLVSWRGAGARQFPEDPAEATALATFKRLKGSVTDKYFGNDDLEAFMLGMAEACSDVMSVFEFGQAGSGRRMLAVDVSASAGERDSKPYFHWLANMHGNEPSGRQLLLATALHMCENPQDAAVRDTLAGMHVIMVPTLNPDGFERKRRGDRNDVDLNRSFPDRRNYTDLNLTPTGTEPAEVRALMELVYTFPFVAGCNMHEGALVANYPWDGDAAIPVGHAAAPDDAALLQLAGAFAGLHATMSDQDGPPAGFVGIADTFDGGVTNGNAWYPVFGGMQDWLYVMAGSLELTLELSPSKWPEGRALQQVWEDTKPALMQYPLRATLGGVRGTARVAGGTSAAAATPSANITGPRGSGAGGVRVSVAAGGLPFYTDPLTGSFYRALPPGEHTLVFEATGAQGADSASGAGAVTRTVTVPPDGTGATLDVELEPAPDTLPKQDADTAGAQEGGSDDQRWAGANSGSESDSQPALMFPYAVLAGRASRGPPAGQNHDAQGTNSKLDRGGALAGAQDSDNVVATKQGATAGAAAAGADVDAAMAEHSGRVSLWVAGRWALFMGGVVWLGYKVAVWRAGRWPGSLHRGRAGSRRHEALL